MRTRAGDPPVPPGRVLTRRGAGVPGPLRDRPRLALRCRTPTRRSPIQRLAEFKFAHFRLRPGRHGCSAPPRRRDVGGVWLLLRPGVWGELTRGVRWGGCADPARKTTPFPCTSRGTSQGASHPHQDYPMLMRTVWRRLRQGFFYITVPYCPGRFFLGPGVSVSLSENQDENFNPQMSGVSEGV